MINTTGNSLSSATHSEFTKVFTDLPDVFTWGNKLSDYSVDGYNEIKIRKLASKILKIRR